MCFRRTISAAILLAVAAPQAARADDADNQPKTIWEQDRLFDFDARSKLDDLGYKFGLQETDEVLGNTQGGLRTGAVFEGNTLASLTVDTGKALGLDGGTFYVSAYQIHGRGPTANLVGNLQTISNIEADRALRLYGLYYEQALLGGKLAVRVGQFGADEEFMVSTYGTVFINSSFGFPALAALDLPSGGPAYPLAAVGGRIKYQPADSWTLLAALFNGDPAGPGPGDPQERDYSGTSFRVNDGAFAIAEAQYALNQQDNATGLPGIYRVGFWYNSNDFQDPSDPTEYHHGNWSPYVGADQMVWRRSGTKDQGIALFARIMGAPADRNLVDFYVDGGVNWKGVIPSRPDDTLGLGAAYLHIGDHVRTAEQAAGGFVQATETVLEATYAIQAAGWWILQPDLQYVIRPDAGAANPLDPSQPLHDALVIGVRSTITF